jgi:hypothetical protein
LCDGSVKSVEPAKWRMFVEGPNGKTGELGERSKTVVLCD